MIGPLRVLHLIDGLAAGGSERLLWDIVRLTKADGLEHTILTVLAESPEYVYAARLRDAGVYRQGRAPRWLSYFRDWRASLSPGKFRRFLFAPLLFVNALLVVREVIASVRTYPPSVIHAHTFFGYALGLGVSVVLRVPLVHTVPCTFQQLRDAHVGWMIWCYRRLHPLVRTFFTGMPHELRSLGIPQAKIEPLVGGIDTRHMAAIRSSHVRAYEDVRSLLSLPPDSLIALSVGRLHSSKGHLHALEAVARLLPEFPQLHWVLLGEGTERQLLLRRAAELGITEHVHLVGFVQEPTPYYLAANVYLRTMLYESENLSSFQAMALGVPVVGFDTKVETELLLTVGHGILVPTGSSGALATAVAEILSLTDRGTALGRRGAEFAASHLDVRELIRTFLRTYRDVAGA